MEGEREDDKEGGGTRGEVGRRRKGRGREEKRIERNYF